ncbi:MAG: hypothetical protein F4137_25180 [Acidobacteria bacterium]|nr:hypothetical protein [Acidobacteriota bacterium]
MTEHLSVALLMPACWLLVTRRDQPRAAFLVGILLSAATLTRTNLAVVVLVLGALYFRHLVRPGPDSLRLAFPAYCLGGSVPLIPLLFLYWIADGMDVFVLSVVLVPLHFASSQLGIAETLVQHVENWLSALHDIPYVILPATLLIGVGLAAHATHRGRELLRGDDGILLLVVGAVSLSVLNSGAAFAHYVLQVLPLVMLLAAVGFQRMTERRLGAGLFLGLYVVVVGGSLARFGQAAFAQDIGRPGRSIAAIQEAANLIGKDRCCGELVYAPHEHLIYWYLKQLPPSSIVHPSAVNQPAIMTPLVSHGYASDDEQRRILERNVGYIVLDPDRKESYLFPEQRRRITAILEERFRPWRNSGKLVIYKRKRPDQHALRSSNRPSGSQAIVALSSAPLDVTGYSSRQ